MHSSSSSSLASTPRRRRSRSSSITSSQASIKHDSRVHVFVRARPFSDFTTQAKIPLDYPSEKEIRLTDQKQETTYRFDHVFSPSATNQEVCNVICSPLIDAVLNGYNGSFLVYGQSGTGKSFTVQSQDGLIPTTISELFNRVDSDKAHSYKVVMSYLQIYHERIYDLLDPQKEADMSLREHPTEGILIEGLTEFEISSTKEAEQLIALGKKQLVVAQTKMVRMSSRSHSICLLKVKKTVAPHDQSKHRFSMIPDTTLDESSLSVSCYYGMSYIHSYHANFIKPEEACWKGKLYLCDLAGSERLKKSGISGDRLKEARYINSSLLELGNVIHALSASRHQHVPFRNSTLTRLLKESLGGNSRASLMICISSSPYHISETKCSLNFGQRALRVTKSSSPNVEPADKKNAGNEESSSHVAHGYTIMKPRQPNMLLPKIDYKALSEYLSKKLKELETAYNAEKQSYIKMQEDMVASRKGASRIPVPLARPHTTTNLKEERPRTIQEANEEKRDDLVTITETSEKPRVQSRGVDAASWTDAYTESEVRTDEDLNSNIVLPLLQPKKSQSTWTDEEVDISCSIPEALTVKEISEQAQTTSLDEHLLREMATNTKDYVTMASQTDVNSNFIFRAENKGTQAANLQDENGKQYSDESTSTTLNFTGEDESEAKTEQLSEVRDLKTGLEPVPPLPCHQDQIPDFQSGPEELEKGNISASVDRERSGEKISDEQQILQFEEFPSEQRDLGTNSQLVDTCEDDLLHDEAKIEKLSRISILEVDETDGQNIEINRKSKEKDILDKEREAEGLLLAHASDEVSSDEVRIEQECVDPTLHEAKPGIYEVVYSDGNEKQFGDLQEARERQGSDVADNKYAIDAFSRDVDMLDRRSFEDGVVVTCSQDGRERLIDVIDATQQENVTSDKIEERRQINQCVKKEDEMEEDEDDEENDKDDEEDYVEEDYVEENDEKEKDEREKESKKKREGEEENKEKEKQEDKHLEGKRNVVVEEKEKDDESTLVAQDDSTIVADEEGSLKSHKITSSAESQAEAIDNSGKIVIATKSGHTMTTSNLHTDSSITMEDADNNNSITKDEGKTTTANEPILQLEKNNTAVDELLTDACQTEIATMLRSDSGETKLSAGHVIALDRSVASDAKDVSVYNNDVSKAAQEGEISASSDGTEAFPCSNVSESEAIHDNQVLSENEHEHAIIEAVSEFESLNMVQQGSDRSSSTKQAHQENKDIILSEDSSVMLLQEDSPKMVLQEDSPEMLCKPNVLYDMEEHYIEKNTSPMQMNLNSPGKSVQETEEPQAQFDDSGFMSFDPNEEQKMVNAPVGTMVLQAQNHVVKEGPSNKGPLNKGHLQGGIEKSLLSIDSQKPDDDRHEDVDSLVDRDVKPFVECIFKKSEPELIEKNFIEDDSSIRGNIEQEIVAKEIQQQHDQDTLMPMLRKGELENVGFLEKDEEIVDAFEREDSSIGKDFHIMSIGDRTSEINLEDDKEIENKAVDDRFGENRAADDNVGENKVADDKGEENKAVDDKTGESKAVDVRVWDNKSIGVKAAKDKAVDDEVEENKAIDDKVIEKKTVGVKIAESKSIDDEVGENKAVNDKEKENKAVDDEEAENQAVDDEVGENKATYDDVGMKKATYDDVGMKKATYDDVGMKKATDDKIIENKATYDEVGENKATYDKIIENKATYDDVEMKKATYDEVGENKATYDKIIENKATYDDVEMKKATYDEVGENKATYDKIIENKATYDDVEMKKATYDDVGMKKATDDEVGEKKAAKNKAVVDEKESEGNDEKFKKSRNIVESKTGEQEKAPITSKPVQHEFPTLQGTITTDDQHAVIKKAIIVDNKNVERQRFRPVSIGEIRKIKTPTDEESNLMLTSSEISALFSRKQSSTEARQSTDMSTEHKSKLNDLNVATFTSNRPILNVSPFSEENSCSERFSYSKPISPSPSCTSTDSEFNRALKEKDKLKKALGTVKSQYEGLLQEFDKIIAKNTGASDESMSISKESYQMALQCKQELETELSKAKEQLALVVAANEEQKQSMLWQMSDSEFSEDTESVIHEESEDGEIMMSPRATSTPLPLKEERGRVSSESTTVVKMDGGLSRGLPSKDDQTEKLKQSSTAEKKVTCKVDANAGHDLLNLAYKVSGHNEEHSKQESGRNNEHVPALELPSTEAKSNEASQVAARQFHSAELQRLPATLPRRRGSNRRPPTLILEEGSASDFKWISKRAAAVSEEQAKKNQRMTLQAIENAELKKELLLTKLEKIRLEAMLSCVMMRLSPNEVDSGFRKISVNSITSSTSTLKSTASLTNIPQADPKSPFPPRSPIKRINPRIGSSLSGHTYSSSPSHTRVRFGEPYKAPSPTISSSVFGHLSQLTQSSLSPSSLDFDISSCMSSEFRSESPMPLERFSPYGQDDEDFNSPSAKSKHRPDGQPEEEQQLAVAYKGKNRMLLAGCLPFLRKKKSSKRHRKSEDRNRKDDSENAC
eukprot:gene5306-5975_t